MAVNPQPRPLRRDNPSRSVRGQAPPAAPAWRAPAPAPEQPALLDSLLRVVRRRKAWILSALVLVPLAVLALTLTQEKRYTATANLLFRDAATALLAEDTSGGTFNDPSRQAQTNNDLIALPVVAERAADLLVEERPGERYTREQIEDSVTVEAGGESDLVNIEAEADSGLRAALVANRYGEAYIAFRQASDRRQLQEAITLAQDRLDRLPVAERSGTAGSSLQERLNRLLLAQSLLTGNAELVQRASVPDEPSSPKLELNLALGLLFGGALGLALGTLRERVDQSIKTDDELEEVYGSPVLARLPRSRALDRDGADLERTPEAEALRILRANLRFFDVDDGLRSVLISSPTSGDGKSTIARGLATTMAAMGDSVVLVEADLHKARAALPTERPERGLSSVLAGLELDEALEHVPVGDGERTLAVLPSGPVPPNPVELLESDRMSALLRELEERFSLVLIDSPALAQVSDARPLVGLVSGVLIVSALGHTKRSAAVDFRKQLQLLEAHPLGVVANFATLQRSGYYYS